MNKMVDQHPEVDRNSDSNLAAVRAICSIVFAAIFGLACAFLALSKEVLPHYGLGSVNRIAELGRRLEQPFSQHPVAACLGSSIILEGMDAALVEGAAGNHWHVENFAISGCAVNEFWVLLPKVLEGYPDAVVLPFLPFDLGRFHDLNLDKAFAYAYGGFVEAWPHDWTHADLPGIGLESYTALYSSRMQQELHFRTVPSNLLNQGVRKLLRSGLRDVSANDWIAPFEMLDSIHDERLDTHLSTLAEQWHEDLAHGQSGKQCITKLIPYVHSIGTQSVLVAFPVHPRLYAEFRATVDELKSLLAELAEQNHGEFIDASELLTASDFADGIHPNAEGRRKYSERVGEALSRLKRDSSQ